MVQRRGRGELEMLRMRHMAQCLGSRAPQGGNAFVLYAKCIAPYICTAFFSIFRTVMFLRTTACLARAMCLLALLSLLHACGFRLRGSDGSTASFEALHVAEQGAPRLAIAMRDALLRSGTDVDVHPDTAAFRAVLYRERFTRELLSISSATGKAQEYQLTLDAVLRLSDRQGEVFIDDESLRVSGEYTYDATAPLAASEQEADIQNDLLHRWSWLALRRMEQVAVQDPPQPVDDPLP